MTPHRPAFKEPPALQAPLLFLMGPTASGKTKQALALAAEFPEIEIVCVDAVTVYQGMDIGSAKPTAEEQSAVPHHLLDLIPPEACYSAARFLEDAYRATRAIWARGHLPLFVGGTALYFKVWLEGLSPLPASQASVRMLLESEASSPGGLAKMHQRLSAIDPLAAQRIDPHDLQRIVRALEVFQISGKPISHLWKLHAPQPPLPVPPCRQFILMPPGALKDLREPITERFDQQLRDGLEAEVAALLTRGLPAQAPSLRSVGYRQMADYLLGKIRKEEAREKAIQATLGLAKRQLTWFKHWKAPCTHLDPLHGPKAWDALRQATHEAICLLQKSPLIL